MKTDRKATRQIVVGVAMILAVVFLFWALDGGRPHLARWQLEREAREWGRKKVILPSEVEDYRDFTMRYRREFGRDWDAPAD